MTVSKQNTQDTFGVTITVPPVKTDLRKLVLPLKPLPLLRMESQAKLLGAAGVVLLMFGLIWIVGLSTPSQGFVPAIAVVMSVTGGVMLWFGGGNFTGAKMLWDRLTTDQRVLQNLLLARLTFCHDQAPDLYLKDKTLRLQPVHELPPEPAFKMYATMTELAREFDAALLTLKVELERALRPLGAYTRKQVELSVLEGMLFDDREMSVSLRQAVREVMRLDALLVDHWKKAHADPALQFALPPEMVEDTPLNEAVGNLDAMVNNHQPPTEKAAA